MDLWPSSTIYRTSTYADSCRCSTLPDAQQRSIKIKIKSIQNKNSQQLCVSCWLSTDIHLSVLWSPPTRWHGQCVDEKVHPCSQAGVWVMEELLHEAVSHICRGEPWSIPLLGGRCHSCLGCWTGKCTHTNDWTGRYQKIWIRFEFPSWIHMKD